MKSVNASCTSESFQPVAPMIGWTKSVQAYCRFAIMIIATTAALSRTQRFTEFPFCGDRASACVLDRLFLAPLRCGRFFEEFCAGVDGARVRHGHAQPLADFDHRAHYGFELHRPAGFEVLQHGRLVLADFRRASHPLIDRDGKLDAQLGRDGLDFGHDVCEPAPRLPDRAPSARASRASAR